MYQIGRNNRRSEDGFTFIEALLHLLLFVVFAHLIYFLVMEFNELSGMQQKRIEADWEIGVTDISHYLPYDSVVTVSTDGLTVNVTTPHHTYNLRFLNNTLWKRQKSGNETLLTGVKNATFFLDDNKLVLKAQLESGVEKERIFIVVQSAE
ncbi:hypothetical protein AAGS61_11725 [Lysinibacillus sp. KU-BSD001]|uniref:hypothetical protein n=1 Tax=Lysinibacillus sp. KU-BSD001 TaxID=3141328 RepID=UPI0036E0514B